MEEAIVCDLGEITALLAGERRKPPIAEDEQIDAGDAGRVWGAAARIPFDK